MQRDKCLINALTGEVATGTIKTVGEMRASTGKDWYLTFNFHHVQCAAELTAFR